MQGLRLQQIARLGEKASRGRLLGTAAPAQESCHQAKKQKAMEKKATHSTSFVQNMFRGLVVSEQTFPYPKVLNAEQADNLAMLVDPTEKFMAEANDPLANDANEQVAEDTIQVR